MFEADAQRLSAQSGSVESDATKSDDIAADYRLLLSVELEAIYIYDDTWRIIATNATAPRVYGYAAEEFVGLDTRLLSAMPERESARLSQLEAGRTVTVSGCHRRKDGSTFPVDISTAVELRQGRRQICAIVRDNSERKRVEQALIDSEQRFRALSESSASGVLIHEGGKIVEANHRMAEMSGYSVAELIGRDVLELAAPDSRPVIAESIVQGVEHPYEIVGLRADGSTFFAEIEARTTRFNGKPTRVATVRDISIGKQAAVPTGQINAQLKQQQKLESIGMLAAGVAHEINNPITGIINYAELIRRNAGETDERLGEAARQIVHEAERVGGLVRNLLSFSRPEQPSRALLRVVDVVSGALSLLQTIVSKDQIELTIDVPDDLPPVRCHAQQIQQVLMNLITNARDALNARYPRFDENKTIRVSARELVEGDSSAGQGDPGDTRWIHVTVEDHGTGIPKDLLDSVFMPFFTTKGQAQGTGLGLSVSQGIIAEHSGRMGVESELGAYTRFSFDLPVAAPLAPIASGEFSL